MGAAHPLQAEEVARPSWGRGAPTCLALPLGVHTGMYLMNAYSLFKVPHQRVAPADDFILEDLGANSDAPAGTLCLPHRHHAYNFCRSTVSCPMMPSSLAAWFELLPLSK